MVSIVREFRFPREQFQGRNTKERKIGPRTCTYTYEERDERKRRVNYARARAFRFQSQPPLILFRCEKETSRSAIETNAAFARRAVNSPSIFPFFELPRNIRYSFEGPIQRSRSIEDVVLRLLVSRSSASLRTSVMFLLKAKLGNL